MNRANRNRINAPIINRVVELNKYLLRISDKAFKLIKRNYIDAILKQGATGSIMPTGGVTFSVLSQTTTGTQTVVTINAAGNFLYTPKGSCRAIPKQFNEQFRVAFIGAANAVPTIALTALQTVISPDNIKDKCNCNLAYGVSMATPLTIAATYPA